MVLYIRNEVILPNVGHHGNAFVPYLLTAFFSHTDGQPAGTDSYGSTATGNISVQPHWRSSRSSWWRSPGCGHWQALLQHDLHWNTGAALPIRVLMFIIMSPVEIIGKFTKPFALAIRLFANMTAGHIVLLAFLGLIFTFKSIVSAAPFAMAVGISLLEIFVAFLQAFIFTLLSAVFIGQIREAHH
jgi:F-type H+-transporting ATPase subunit a